MSDHVWMYIIPILLSDPFEKRKILLDIQKRFVERIEHKIQMVKNQSDGKIGLFSKEIPSYSSIIYQIQCNQIWPVIQEISNRIIP